MKSFFTSLLTESGKSNISSKRFIGVVGFFALLIAFFVGMFYDINRVPAWAPESITYITIASLFSTTFEKLKFGSRAAQAGTQSPQTP